MERFLRTIRGTVIQRKKCKHGKRRNRCVQCGGRAICKHTKRRRRCTKCAGPSICSHGRRKRRCNECLHAPALCRHGKRIERCHQCGGNSLCEHGCERTNCVECPHAVIPWGICQACGSKHNSRIKGVPGTEFCAECRDEYGLQRIKKWEVQTEAWLGEYGLLWSHSNHKLPCAPTTRYPDYMFVAKEHCVLLEVDEDQHVNYNASCEVARISELMDSIDFKNLHVIRYNPNAKGKTDDKKRALLDSVHAALGFNFGGLNDTGCVVEYLGYEEDRIVMLDQLACSLQRSNK